MNQTLPDSSPEKQPRTGRRQPRAIRLRAAAWLRFAVLCLLPSLLLMGGCNGCDEDKPEPQPVAEPSPVPAPDHHAADLFIRNPADTYKNIRTRVGGALTLLPASFPSMVVTVLGLSPQLLEQIDGKSPVFGVMTDDGTRAVVVMGVHLRNGARAIELLTVGADARYTAAPAKEGVVVLEPKPTLRSRTAALGVAGNYLLAGEKADDLLNCGPYVTRTLPKRPEQEGEIVMVATASALKGPITKRIRETWSSFRKEREQEDEKLRKSKGREPDFGEPAAALADVAGKVETFTALLSDLESAKLRIDTDAAGIHAMATMNPASKDGVAAKAFASMETGDLAPLLAMPQDTVLGVLMRDSARAREAGAKEQAEGLADLLGERLDEKGKASVHAALSAWAKGRGDWMAAAIRWTRDEQAAIVRGSVKDPDSLRDGLRSFVALAEVPAFREPIEHRLGKMSFGKPQQLGEGAFVHVVRDKKVPEGEKAKKSAFDVAWRIDQDAKRFEARASEDAKQWLTQDEPPKEPALGEHPTTSKVFAGIGADTSFALFVDPQLFIMSLAPKRAKVKETSSPFVFAYGGNQTQGWFKIVLAHATARELVKLIGRNVRE